MNLLKVSKTCFMKFRQIVERETPWSVDRFGRLFAGTGTLIFTVLSIAHSPYFLIPVLLINLNLIITSFSDKCAMRDLLKKLGAEEREKIYMSDGTIKSDKNCAKELNLLTEKA